MKYKAIVRVIGMTRPMRMLRIFLATVVALILVATTPVGWADDKEEIPFDVADVFFQLNDTDGDLGIHADIDGEAWKRLVIEDPNERRMLTIRLNGRLRRQGLTELSFESAEPTFDELPPKKFFRRFPEGEYEIEGMTLEGQELESTDELTHVMPAPPDNLLVSGMATPEDCDADPGPLVNGSVIISWDPVTQSHPEIGKSGPIEIVAYELAVEREEPTKLVLTVDLPPEVTELEIPSGFIAQGDAFKFQVLATEASGNETSAESCFVLR